MSKLNIFLLAVLCVTTVPFGADGRSLKKEASSRGKISASAANGQSFVAGKAESTEGDAKVTAAAVAKAASFVKSDLVQFFKYVANKEKLAECFKYDKGGSCCVTVSSRIREDFWATAVAHAKSFAAVKADVAVNGEGKACGGGGAAAKAFAESFIQIVIDAIAEAYGRDYYQSARESVKTQFHLLAKTYSEVNLVACVEDNSKATAYIEAAAEAYTSAIVEIFLRLNAQFGCRGTGSSNNTERKVTPTEKTQSQVLFGGYVDGTGNIAADGLSNSFTDIREKIFGFGH